jgi:hypothetical protein
MSGFVAQGTVQTQVQEVPVSMALREVEEVLKKMGYGTKPLFESPYEVRRRCAKLEGRTRWRRTPDLERVMRLVGASNIAAVRLLAPHLAEPVCVPPPEFLPAAAAGLVPVYEVRCEEPRKCADVAEAAAAALGIELPEMVRRMLLGAPEEAGPAEAPPPPPKAEAAPAAPAPETGAEAPETERKPEPAAPEGAWIELVADVARQRPEAVEAALRAAGFEWLAPAIRDATTRRAVQELLSDPELAKALAEGGIKELLRAPPPAAGPAPQHWPKRDAELLARELPRSRDAADLAARLFAALSGCDLDAARSVIDALASAPCDQLRQLGRVLSRAR